MRERVLSEPHRPARAGRSLAAKDRAVDLAGRPPPRHDFAQMRVHDRLGRGDPDDATAVPAKAPPGKATPPTSMTVDNVTGPDGYDCGEYVWRVNFTLPTPSVAGGIFVQEVTGKRTGTNCGKGTATDCARASHFWEAWRVKPGDTQEEEAAAGKVRFTDEFAFGPCGTGTSGAFSVVGSVRFHEGLTIPKSFIPNNPDTFAREVPSTTANPKLSGGTPAKAHAISGRWSCCPKAAKTEFDSHTP
jgi:hypothetical protein